MKIYFKSFLAVFIITLAGCSHEKSEGVLPIPVTPSPTASSTSVATPSPTATANSSLGVTRIVTVYLSKPFTSSSGVALVKVSLNSGTGYLPFTIAVPCDVNTPSCQVLATVPNAIVNLQAAVYQAIVATGTTALIPADSPQIGAGSTIQDVTASPGGISVQTLEQ